MISSSPAGTAVGQYSPDSRACSPRPSWSPPVLTKAQEHLVLLLLQIELIHLQQRLQLLAADVVEDLLQGQKGWHWAGRGTLTPSPTFPPQFLPLTWMSMSRR